MAALPIGTVVVIGGVAYAITRQSGGAPGPSGMRYPPSAGAPVGPNNPANQVGVVYGNPSPITYPSAVGASQTGGLNFPVPGVEQFAQQKLDALQAYTQEQFDNLDEVAKSKAADSLNKQFKLDPPLTGHEDWKTICAALGGASGAAAGNALCGPACGKLGAMAGAFAGEKAAPYAKSAGKYVVKTAKVVEKKVVHAIETSAKKTVGKAAAKVKNLFKSIF